MFDLDYLSLILAVAIIVVSILISLVRGTSSPSHPDVPHSRLNNQAQPSDTRREGESAVYRSYDFKPNLTRSQDGTNSLHTAFLHGCGIDGGRNPCLGYRAVPSAPYSWLTYAEVKARIQVVGSGLLKLGVSPKDNVGIYADNRLEWTLIEQACNAYSMVTVALYATLGDEGVRYIIRQSDLAVVVVAENRLATLLENASHYPCLKTAIKLGADPATPAELERAAAYNVRIVTFKELEALGAASLQPFQPPQPSDVATICWTSGTTDLPKGAILTHENIFSAALGAILSLPAFFRPNKDVHLSYLPMAHIFERVAQAQMFYTGGRVAFYSGDVKKLFDDILEVKPTIFYAVPRIYNRVHQRILGAIAQAGPVAKWLFDTAYAIKKREMENGNLRNNTIWDWLVFNKIRQRLGGRVRLLITSAAPISRDVLEFLRIVFGCQVLEGYGQTENCGCTGMIYGDYATGTVGIPFPHNEMKLMDVPDMNYFATDSPNPRGEICIRGPNVFKGYLKDPQKTADAIDAEGWLHTGDIGMWLPNGTLRIIDRKKNIFKLSQGEYIAPEKIENVFQKSPYVEFVYVHGDSLQTTLVAIVIPAADQLAILATKENIQGLTYTQQCQDPRIQAIIIQDLKQLAKNAHLQGFEQPREFFFDHVPFSVENGLLTPTFKAKRADLAKHYRKQIDAMYAKISDSN